MNQVYFVTTHIIKHGKTFSHNADTLHSIQNNKKWFTQTMQCGMFCQRIDDFDKFNKVTFLNFGLDRLGFSKAFFLPAPPPKLA
jgi:hypothetical protein